MIMKRSTIGKTFAIAAVAALALGIVPAAKADKGCSNATLKDTFVHTASGFVPTGPLADAGADTFDGDGGITSTATLSINENRFSIIQKKPLMVAIVRLGHARDFVQPPTMDTSAGAVSSGENQWA
jgi:hypothetical protein